RLVRPAVAVGRRALVSGQADARPAPIGGAMPNDARNRRGPRRARPEPAPPPEPAPRARNAPPLRLIGLAAMIAGVLAAMPWPVDRKPRPQQGAQPQRAPAALPFDTVAPCEPTLPVA